LTDQPTESLSKLFSGGGRAVRHRPGFRHNLGKTSPPENADEADARRLLALVWPSVRRIKPTPQERRARVWEMGPFGPYIGVRPPPLYVSKGESDGHDDLARWDGHVIMYDEDAWCELAYKRLDVIIHECLHAVGFFHGRRGTGRTYRRVISRAKRAMPKAALREARNFTRVSNRNRRTATPDTRAVRPAGSVLPVTRPVSPRMSSGGETIDVSGVERAEPSPPRSCRICGMIHSREIPCP
jgi:hypothetical protein